MKKTAIIFVILACTTMSSCLVNALHPFYTKKDKIYDEQFIGNWMDGDSCLWIIEHGKYQAEFLGAESPDSTYNVTYMEDGDITYLKGVLFELEGNRYIDFTPTENDSHFKSDMSNFHHVPVHTLARIKIVNGKVLIFWFGEEWLDDLLDENRIRIAHETINTGSGYARHLLTAPTKELQKFIIKYANEEEITQEIEEAFESGNDEESEYDGDHAFVMLSPYDGPLPEDN